MHSQHCGSLQIELHNVQMSLRCSRLYFIFAVYMLRFLFLQFHSIIVTIQYHDVDDDDARKTICDIYVYPLDYKLLTHTHTANGYVLAQETVAGGWGAHKCFAQQSDCTETTVRSIYIWSYVRFRTNSEIKFSFIEKFYTETVTEVERTEQWIGIRIWQKRSQLVCEHRELNVCSI